MTMSAAELVFWVSVGAVAYTYALYPLLLFLLASLTQTSRDILFLLTRRSRRGGARREFEPRVALLIAAYNEEDVIEEKLRNTAQLDYPAEKMEVLLGLDAPSDSTPERAARFPHPGLRVFPFPARRGKLAVISDLAQRTTADILIFSDANTILEPDCVRRLVRHFARPMTGAVCGELRLVSPGGKTEMEGLYWRYEVALKFLENRLNCVLGANGGVYAVRRSLFRPMQKWIVEDFQLPMEIRYEGHRVVYDPEAVGAEEAAPTLAAEYRRKVRIGAGAYQTLLRNPHFLNPFKGLPAFAYFSHKVVRWLVPLFLLAALVSNAVLAARPFFAAALAAQAAFYLLALAGYSRQRHGAPAGIFAVAYYFSVMNLALLHGMARYLTGRQQVMWTATPRTVPSPGVPTKREAQ
ncbi:MAG: glycosyltransferase family 2 protein [Acidobacteria bacterium]|nr:glycosyltransferase family 2 protein [Acidobacteriota bacterium]MBI3661924.1 glycosyltransferase family 2 protein [Acidobacteriota bacterium]